MGFWPQNTSAAAVTPDPEQDDHIVEINDATFIQVGGSRVTPFREHADQVIEVNCSAVIEVTGTGWGTGVGGTVTTNHDAANLKTGWGSQSDARIAVDAACTWAAHLIAFTTELGEQATTK